MSANHSTNGRNLNPLYNSISAWVEVSFNFSYKGALSLSLLREYHLKVKRRSIALPRSSSKEDGNARGNASSETQGQLVGSIKCPW